MIPGGKDEGLLRPPVRGNIGILTRRIVILPARTATPRPLLVDG